MLTAAGWAVQDYKAFDSSASIGIALREVPLKSDRCDYLLLANRKPVGVVEAKKEGVVLSTVTDQSAHHAKNLPDFLAAIFGSDSLPFYYVSTGAEFRTSPQLRIAVTVDMIPTGPDSKFPGVPGFPPRRAQPRLLLGNERPWHPHDCSQRSVNRLR